MSTNPPYPPVPEDRNVEKSKNVPPFVKFVCANVPMVFDDSLSYYEALSALWKWMQTELTDVVNNNASVTNEYITLTLELREYMKNYFDNLDVQEEINNKLDAMVKDGTMDTIINQEIFGELNDKINLINSEKTVFVGDSYALGVNPDSDTLTPWCNVTANLMGLTSGQYNIVAEAGSGFVRNGTYGHTFLTKLQSVISSITDKNSVKNVIVCGGYNDSTYTITEIKDAISSFVNYCKQQFPNATVYIGCIGYRYEINDSAAATRNNIASVVYPAYSNNVSGSYSTASYVYLNGVENILKTIPKSYMYANNAHPNQVGQNMLGRGIYQAFKTGYVKSYSSNTITITNTNANSVSATVNVKHCDNQMMITVNNIYMSFDSGTFSLQAQSQLSTIGQYSSNAFIGGCVKEYSAVTCTVNINDYNLNRRTLPATLIFDTDGTLKLQLWNINPSTGYGQSFTDVKEITILRCNMTMPELFS